MERSKMQKLIDMLKRHEGEVKTNGRHVIYKCPAGFYTLGIGRNVDMNDGVGLSDDEVQYLLENDIERVIKERTDIIGSPGHMSATRPHDVFGESEEDI